MPSHHRAPKWGMLMLASHKVRHLINIYKTHEFFIRCQIGALNVACVYVPPSMKEKEITAIFQESPPVEILFGDFNFRRGAINGDSITSAPRRKKIIERMAAA
eukprot:Sdes_comp20987_c1_seq1m19519